MVSRVALDALAALAVPDSDEREDPCRGAAFVHSAAMQRALQRVAPLDGVDPT